MKKLTLLLTIIVLSSFTQGDATTASWYGKHFHGRKMANGDIFNKWAMTCASNLYKLGTKLRITNVHNEKSVVVTVTDRIHPKFKNRVDLSRGAFEKIAILDKGVIKIKVDKL